MTIHHGKKYINGDLLIYIYVEYPVNYEFGLDFDTAKKNVKNVSDKILNYLEKNFHKHKKQTFAVILNGLMVGTLIYPSTNMQTRYSLKPDTSIETVVDKKEITDNLKDNKNISTNENTNINEENLKTLDSNDTNNPMSASYKNTDTPKVIKKKENTSKNVANSSTIPKNPVNNNNSGKSNANIGGKKINLKLNSGSVIQIGLEDYVVGVVASEMPISFNLEALKAQAVAARTYALKITSGGSSISATTSHQVYRTNDELKKLWGSNYNSYYEKVKSAVEATKNKTITYGGKYIEALYFSTSNGKTEDAKYVWGNSIPYLKSVDSSFDIGIPTYASTKTFTYSQLSSKLGVTINNNSEIKILSRTSGNRVNEVSIAGKKFTGVKIRSLLGLRSADFEIKKDGSIIKISSKGFGHGVGMSQYGANALGKSGKNYIEILKHYYTGVTIS